MNSKEEKAKDQLKKAQEMLGISDDRAEEIFTPQADRKQQQRKEIEEKKRQIDGE